MQIIYQKQDKIMANYMTIDFTQQEIEKMYFCFSNHRNFMRLLHWVRNDIFFCHCEERSNEAISLNSNYLLNLPLRKLQALLSTCF